MWKFLSHSFWLTTRDFSSRKLEIFPPSGSPPRLNWISKYFPCPGTAAAQSRSWGTPGPTHSVPFIPPHQELCWDGSQPRCRPSAPAPVTYEAAGVVVADGFGIPEGFQQRVGLQDDVLHVLGAQETKELSQGGTHLHPTAAALPEGWGQTRGFVCPQPWSHHQMRERLGWEAKRCRTAAWGAAVPALSRHPRTLWRCSP